MIEPGCFLLLTAAAVIESDSCCLKMSKKLYFGVDKSMFLPELLRYDVGSLDPVEAGPPNYCYCYYCYYCYETRLCELSLLLLMTLLAVLKFNLSFDELS